MRKSIDVFRLFKILFGVSPDILLVLRSRIVGVSGIIH